MSRTVEMGGRPGRHGSYEVALHEGHPGALDRDLGGARSPRRLPAGAAGDDGGAWPGRRPIPSLPGSGCRTWRRWGMLRPVASTSAGSRAPTPQDRDLGLQSSCFSSDSPPFAVSQSPSSSSPSVGRFARLASPAARNASRQALRHAERMRNCLQVLTLQQAQHRIALALTRHPATSARTRRHHRLNRHPPLAGHIR